ncbi:hypothetical protein [Methanoregula sp.]|uniref:hypothetical protein n=1 Tax=Methanoregula sp. TaxID=2052170 RepID=UPI000CA68121|nr:hypothetical protein [Methanoregula sp.]PKG33258.1 MAG: hypothetical protein CW742_03935 [Methanoregula sp.]
MCRNICLGFLALLAILVLAANAGCSGPEHPPAVTQAPSGTATTPLPATPAASATPLVTATQSAHETNVLQPANTTIAPVTIGPSPTPTQISEAALNARIVDARNKLEMFIDSDVADTEIVHTGSPHNCDVKKSKEIGYLIDVNTGESTFIKGDYWSINANLFSGPMRKDREYIIIHTHPRMWVTCGGSGIYSLYTFSIGDLAATANLTKQGYQVQKLIAIADKDYRIWPYERDGWKTDTDIMHAVDRIETRVGRPFSYYDPVFEQTFYDVDNLMPLLAEELNYHYTVNNNIIN